MNTVQKSNELAKKICSGNYRYLYGGKDEKYTKALVEKLAKAYPSVYTSSLKAEALKDADKGYMAIDCSGFVCKVLGISAQGSGQLRNSAIKRLSVKKENAKPGMALWRNGHIAYVGEDLKVYEAQSTKTDMKVSEWGKRASAFTELLVVKGSYLANTDTFESKTTNTYKEPENTLKKGDKGEEVKWLQYKLKQAGYNISVDGEFGNITLAKVKNFQKAKGLVVDGIVGNKTITELKKY